jgi:hypothetical protein
MAENNISKQTRGVTLREPKDVRRIIQRITSKAFQEGLELEYAGRIAQLMGCWMKAWEMDKISDIERRVEALEKIREKESNETGKDT